MNTRTLILPLILIATTSFGGANASTVKDADAQAQAAALLRGAHVTPPAHRVESAASERVITDGHRQAEALLRGQAFATSSFAQSAKDVRGASPQGAKDIRGASPYVEIRNEPAPKLVVDPPLPEGLALGVLWAQYRVENLRIVPVFGPGAVDVSPRVGHLHITVDDLPWWWADASDNNTVDIAGLPPGEHKVKIELVDSNHNVFTGQVATLRFTIPSGAKLHTHTPTG